MEDSPIVRVMRQVFETNGIVRQNLTRAGLLETQRQRNQFNQEREDLVLMCFLKHTVFWGVQEIPKDRLNTYSRLFAAEGRVVEKGWMLERETWRSRPDEPSWKLSICP